MVKQLIDVSHVALGTSLGFVLMALTFNLDWRHYIRYWVGPSRQYSRKTMIAFRVGFLVVLLFTLWQLFQQVAAGPLAFQDAPYVIVDAVLFAALFFLFDGIARLIWGRPRRD
jgi:hypothetical protein